MFVFPFDHHSETSQKTYQRIEKGLRQLNEQSLLFLEYVDEIVWTTDKRTESIKRTVVEVSQDCQRITITKNEIKNSWLVFSKSTPSKPTERVAVAFRLQRESGSSAERIRPVKGSPLIVFLPTGLETDLHFLVHGPYVTTPARDNILRDECEENAALISLTARLVAEIPIRLRDEQALMELNLLNVGFYNTLPIRAEDFEKNKTFAPVFTAVRNAFSKHKLLPSVTKGEYVSARQAKLARGSDLRKLLAPQQISQLFGQECTWISEEITAKSNQTSDFYRYIRTQLNVEEIEAENFARQLTTSFLIKQSDQWISRLYAFLNSRKGLKSTIINRPIIRLEDGRQVPPLKSDGNQPNAYLPIDSEHDHLATVKGSIFSYPSTQREARAFLRDLGLTEPDIVADVIEDILPRYTSHTYGRMPECQHKEHLKTIMKALGWLKSSSTASAAALDRLDSLKRCIKDTPFLKATNAAHSSQKAYQKPESLYFPEPDLKMYFSGSADIWFLDEDETDIDEALLKELGVRKDVRVFAKNPDSSGHVILEKSHGHHKRGLYGFYPKAKIDGLKHALKNPSISRSAFIWNNIFLPSKRCIRYIEGYTESSNRQNYASPETKKILEVSPIGAMLRRSRWLPDAKGKFHRPENISAESASG